MRHLRLAALVSCTLVLTGCLVSSHSDESYSGNYISAAKLAEIKVNESSEADVRNKLGEPDDRATLANGDVEWRWHYSKSVLNKSAVFLIAASDSSRTIPGRVVITMRDGIVQSKRYITDVP